MYESITFGYELCLFTLIYVMNRLVECGQVIWELADRWWLAGDAMCRVLKYAQSFAIMSSVNMLVVLSVDRHQAVCRPLRPPPSVCIIIVIKLYEGSLHSSHK